MSDSIPTTRPSTEQSQSLLEGLSARDLMVQMMEPTHPGDSAAALPPLSPEELAPHFPLLEILECLGRGGMGVVYKARQKSLGRLVALKLLAPERAGDPQFAARFEKEARALATLTHPHIVGVHDFGQAGGFYFLLMEFVDGVNLRQLLQTKRLTPKEALSIVPQVCDALQCAHDNHIVHCDIKPENLLMDRAGTVKIADFGIAKIVGEPDGAESAMKQGTPHYSAPEQVNGTADHRTDIYSLGVVLYELLTGELPHGQIAPSARKANLDVRIDEVVSRALQERPELRYQSAVALRTHVETLLGMPSSPQPRRRAPRTDWGGMDAEVLHSRVSPRRWGSGKVLALGALTLLVVFGAITYFQQPQKPPFRGEVETVDFDSGPLEQSFAVNSVYGNNPYTITNVGVAGTRGLDLDDSTASESTLVFTKKAYDLSKLASLEVSCLFRRQAIGAGSHAVNLGLVETKAGRLSGVMGDGFVSVWLRVEGESLRMQFQTKGPDDTRPRTGPLSDEFITEEGKWYQFKATFTRVSDEGIRVIGDISKASDQGEVGSRVAGLSSRVFWIKDFAIQNLIDDHELWVAIRANGSGGADAIDNVRIAARSLPPKPVTPAPLASPSAQSSNYHRFLRHEPRDSY